MRTECPCCGASLPPNAAACPECGSDEQTGWSEQASLDGLDLPDESFDYDDYVKREFGGKSAGRRLHWVWWAAAVALLAAFLLFWFRR